MAVNFPGPFEVRFTIATNEPAVIGEHQLRLSMNIPGGVNPGEPFSNIFPVQKDGGTDIPLNTHCENLLGAIDWAYSTTSVFGNIELWEYIPNSFDSVFRSSYVPSQEPDNANPTVIASQAYWSFRTVNGGVAKLCLMGTAISEGSSAVYPVGDADVDAVFAYMLGSSVPWIGRDGGFLLSGLRFLPGRNEKLWKKVYRS